VQERGHDIGRTQLVVEVKFGVDAVGGAGRGLSKLCCLLLLRRGLRLWLRRRVRLVASKLLLRLKRLCAILLRWLCPLLLRQLLIKRRLPPLVLQRRWQGADSRLLLLAYARINRPHVLLLLLRIWVRPAWLLLPLALSSLATRAGARRGCRHSLHLLSNCLQVPVQHLLKVCCPAARHDIPHLRVQQFNTPV
jgi:hypothetical protein